MYYTVVQIFGRLLKGLFPTNLWRGAVLIQMMFSQILLENITKIMSKICIVIIVVSKNDGLTTVRLSSDS